MLDVSRCMLEDLPHVSHVVTQSRNAQLGFKLRHHLQELVQNFVVDAKNVHVPKERQDVFVHPQFNVFVGEWQAVYVRYEICLEVCGNGITRILHVHNPNFDLDCVFFKNACYRTDEVSFKPR